VSFYSTVSVGSVKMLAVHESSKFDIMLHTVPCTDEHEHHVDLNHICGVLEPLEYSGTKVLLTVLGVAVQVHKQ
jgi:hypothetical protein